MKQAAKNKYSNYRGLNSISSNITTSNNRTSSNIATASNKTTSNNIYSKIGNGQGTTLIKNMALDQLYYGEMIVGNQKFNMLLDSGSSPFWIPNKNCTSAACQIHKYDSSKSPTFKPEGNPWSIFYQTGTVSGVTGIDNVQIGHIIDTEPDDFISLENDGLCGLAFDELNIMNNGAPTVISTLITQKKINAIFNDAKVNNNPMSFSGKLALIDTGITTMLIPPNDAEAIHEQIPGFEYDSQDGVYIIPCDTTAIVSLKFGGVDYEIPSRDLIFLRISSTQCVSSI
ncbi:11948_t:CDS:2 [Dentiscutata heterogama]|uniref:11948_t:CDS:1 n=1 Tax=Dentiscutata heterogama TaxID=1316150 RepID=A0ACA9MTG0_9GLOM|nr:11948_t:CDS:2 [Dentiscutata heterogama]